MIRSECRSAGVLRLFLHVVQFVLDGRCGGRYPDAEPKDVEECQQWQNLGNFQLKLAAAMPKPAPCPPYPLVYPSWWATRPTAKRQVRTKVAAGKTYAHRGMPRRNGGRFSM